MTNLENALMEAYKEDLISNDEMYTMLSILHEGTIDLSDDQKKFYMITIIRS